MPEESEMLPGLRASVADSRAKAAATRRRRAAQVAPAQTDPVARVLVDLPLAHLDRLFDYLVPEAYADAAVPGARVKVRFAGQDVDGYLVERAAATDHTGRLASLRRVVSAEPVLRPQVLALAGAVAERWAGSRADVLRLAVPPRHATTEARPSPPAGPPPPRRDPVAWAGHQPAEAYLAHLAEGGSPRAVWAAAPGTDWPCALAEAAAATYASGRGSLLVVPDHRDVARVDAALTAALGEGHHVTLTADSGPGARYRDFLSLARGARRIVLGSRAAALAPVADLGLVAVWDDGDDLLAEPRAPYPHAREVLLLRAEQEGCAALVGGFARSVEADQLLRTGWAHEIAAPRALLRERVRVSVLEAGEREHGARVPRAAYDLLREATAEGPVLVQTARAGYAPSLACERCRTPARCAVCTGPLALGSPTAPPGCRWCGTPAPDWSCPTCGHRGLRTPVPGGTRTAEELGRAHPGIPVLTSSGDRVRASVPDRPSIVVATPGAEPTAEGGYAGVLLLDAWLPLARAGLRAEEEALRRWLGAAGMVRPGGRVLAVGPPDHPALQALVRWDPAGFAAREAAVRGEARLPPASRVATVTGTSGAVDDALTLLAGGPDGTEVLGPVPVGEDGTVRAVVRVPRRRGAELARALGEVQRVRSARKLEPVRVQVDPWEIG